MNARKAKPVQRVEIRIAGCLDRQWAEWFEGMELMQITDGETVITGDIIDQAALYGLIGKLRDLGVHLLAITLQEKSAARRQRKISPTRKNRPPDLPPGRG